MPKREIKSAKQNKSLSVWKMKKLILKNKLSNAAKTSKSNKVG